MKNTISLGKNQNFRKVYNKGRSLATQTVVVYIMKNNLGVNRIGVSVSKKVGNSVVRSRVTRIIKEGYRENEVKFKTGYDIVMIGRKAAIDKKSMNIGRDILYLMKRLNCCDE